MADLTVRLGPLTLRNPVITASGTFGYGKEYGDLIPAETVGAITVKGVSSFPAPGNPTPRTAEVFGGMLNAIGLQNPGVDTFLHHPDYMPWLRSADTNVFVNIWGRTIDEYVEVTRRLEAEKDGIDALELNISCPNIKEGGISFGTDLAMARRVIGEVRNATTLPLITKLSPNVTRIADFAVCAAESGSDILSLINTLPGMAIDIATRTPKLANVTGGLSGPAIRPVAVKMVYEAARAVDIPIIGMGGIRSAEDALEFIIAGASAVGVGTSIFSNPGVVADILAGIDQYLNEHDLRSVAELVGTVKT